MLSAGELASIHYCNARLGKLHQRLMVATNRLPKNRQNEICKRWWLTAQSDYLNKGHAFSRMRMRHNRLWH